MISIILPCYNVASYLRRGLDSILAQSYKDYEVILIDDGSVDETGVICDEYASEDSRIRVVHTKNQGVSCARNEGINIAQGDYMYFMDPDDWIEPNCLEICYNTFLETGADCVHFNKWIRRWDKPKEKLTDGDLSEEIVIGRDKIKKQYTNVLIGIGQDTLKHYYNGENLWKYKKPWQVWTFMFSSKVIKENNVIFQPGLKTSEDALFVVDYSIYSKKIARINKYLYHYDFRQNGSLFSRVNDIEKIFIDKYNLLPQRERIRNLISEYDLNDYYLGSHIFSALELVVKLSSKISNYRYVKIYITNELVQESIRKVHLKGAQPKFKIPVLLLKGKLHFPLFLVCWFVHKMGLGRKIKM